ncbi:major facilitator superfamily domain-containing protein [Tricladium varicosporioides]|nr:major facilitator superfamily domain-containing protein [Hymenoscyphus varicosporioides]
MSSRNDSSATDIESAIGQGASPSDSLRNFAIREKQGYKGEEDIDIEVEQEPSDTLTACLQVVGAFFLMMNSWGIANTFGAYQTYYEQSLLSHESPSNISWIGSIQATLLLFVGGLVTGPIYDAGHLRGLVFVGSTFGVFGMMMTSICKEYWQVILAQGVLVGAGAGCLLLPSVAVMPQYFTTKRAFATGVAAAGSSVGGVIYPIVFHELQPRIGFGWTTRAIAFMMLVTLLIPNLVMRAKVFPSTRRPLFDTKVLRSLSYDFFTIGAFFGFMGMYIPFYYITTFSIEKGIAGESLGFYMLALLNAGSVFGRLIPNFFADSIGPLNISTPFILCCAIISFCWPSIHSLPSLILFCIFYGFFSGTFVSITGPSISSLSPDIALVGTHMGMSFGFGSLGLLIGNPVAGVLLERGWTAVAMFCGACNALAAIFIFMSRVKKTGWVWWVRA